VIVVDDRHAWTVMNSGRRHGLHLRWCGVIGERGSPKPSHAGVNAMLVENDSRVMKELLSTSRNSGMNGPSRASADGTLVA
jgi:hypothetical protein